MNCKPFCVDVLVNTQLFLPALFDTDCLPYSAFSKSIIVNKNIPRIPIRPRNLQLEKNYSSPSCTEAVTYVKTDVNGHIERIWAYIIPNLYYNLILGKGWTERNGVFCTAKDRVVKLENINQNIKTLETGWMNSELTKSLTSHVVIYVAYELSRDAFVMEKTCTCTSDSFTVVPTSQKGKILDILNNSYLIIYRITWLHGVVTHIHKAKLVSASVFIARIIRSRRHVKQLS